MAKTIVFCSAFEKEVERGQLGMSHHRLKKKKKKIIRKKGKHERKQKLPQNSISF